MNLCIVTEVNNNWKSFFIGKPFFIGNNISWKNCFAQENQNSFGLEKGLIRYIMYTC